MDPAPSTLVPDHILRAPGDGIIARTPEEVEAAEHLGYVKCHTPTCPFLLSPETVKRIESTTGYYTCARCRQSYHLMNEWPPYGVSPEEAEMNARTDFERGNSFNPGGGTRSGNTLSDVGQIGEDLIEQMKQIPGYGPITWWHGASARDPSPLDGTTQDWGIEVKTIDKTALNHRFIAGGRQRNQGGTRNEIESKEHAAQELGKQGILGILVIIDYYTSTADVYVKPMPIGKYGHFYTHTAEALVAKGVPFRNPLLDPHHPDPSPVTTFQVPGGSF
jgi:hypothetical protein